MQTAPAPNTSSENSSNNSDLSNEEIKKLTSELSSEIDAEIKKQFAQNQALEQTQEKVNEIIKSDEEASEKIDQEPSKLPELKIEPSVTVESSQQEQIPSSEEIHLDPLHSSIETAITNLKEGDQISKDWILKKVLTTSFGNNKSSFYELENKAGAHWTLSPEEMKDVLRTEILAQNNSTEETKEENPNLSPEDNKTPSIRRDDETVLTPTAKETKIEVNESKEKDKTEKEPEKVIFEKESDTKKLNLTKQQIELVNKIHADKNLWEIFTTFSPTIWNRVYDMYENGKLSEVGIDAHPLLDQIENANLGTEIAIEKGSSVNKILNDQGYTLKWNQEDSLILGTHILANYNILSEAIKKVEGSGIAVSPLQSKKEILGLMIKAKNSDLHALHTLQEDLRFLPLNGKFKIIKPGDLEPLKKFI